MKKLFLSMAFVMTLGCMNAMPQKSDAFFGYEIKPNHKESRVNYQSYYDFKSDIITDIDAQKAPIGNGLLILGGLALAYAIRMKNVR